MLNILQIISAISTIVTGLYAFIAPRSVRGFTGLEMPGGRGVTEVRAILGGLFIALGAAPLVFKSVDMFRMLGVAYLGIAVARAVGIVMDKSAERSNLISLAVEIVFGVLLVV